jgi:hypothetical protein
MNDKQAIKESISHWKRMIKWVSKLEDKGVLPDENDMELHLGESWFADCCPLCSQHNSCFGCPLYEAGKGCEERASPWRRVGTSTTWSKWLINARKMLKVLESLMKKS